MRSVKVALAAGFALLALAIGLTLLGSPMSVAHTNKVPGNETTIWLTRESSTFCQAHESLPGGISAIRIWLHAAAGPRVSVVVTSHGHVLTSGSRGSIWVGGSVTIPVKHVSHAVADVTVCVSFQLHDETVIVQGSLTSAARAARTEGIPILGRMGVEFLRPAARSWASQALEVARRMGLGHAGAGTWIVLLVLALVAAIVALVSRLVLGSSPDEPAQKRMRTGTDMSNGGRPAAPAPRRPPRAVLGAVPTAAWICALVAFLNAACWSILTPPFQAPDEPDHFAYVKQIAETWKLPSSKSEQLSSEETSVLLALHAFRIRLEPQVHTIASRAEQSELQRGLVRASTETTPGSPAAGVAASQPPLYYALEALPYTIAGGNELTRLRLMRLMSALFAGLTALFVFLFVHEALPRARWAWAVGGMAIALVPGLGFMSGTVNPDSLLFAVSAASFYALARAFRRGLGHGGAVAIGGLTAVGLLTKLNFIGLAPGVLLGLLVLSVRAARVSGRSAYRLLALGGGIAVSPIVLYVASNALFGHRALGSSRLPPTARTEHF